MRKFLSTIALLALALTSLAATTDGSAVACDVLDGRPSLTAEGYSATFDAPAVTYPGLSSPVDNSIGPESSLRAAPFAFSVDVAPASQARLTIDLTWGGTSDFDVFVLDDGLGGVEIARSADANIEGTGVWAEQAKVTVDHCDQITIRVASWAGSPGETLQLDVAVEPVGDPLACAAGDPAPGCEGKAAGDAPDASVDDRELLYLGGEAPGQVSMLDGYLMTNAGADQAPDSVLTPERPTSGTPDGHTRLVAGFHDRSRNPLVPHWTASFEAFRSLDGDVDAVFWASSRTMDDSGELFAYLFANDVLIASTSIEGAEIGQNPTRHAITFDDVEASNVLNLTLQIATAPLATSEGAQGNPADAEVTVHYGSVQFPSYLSLG